MTVSAARLAEVFVEIADTDGDGFDLSQFLQLVTVRAAEVADAAAAGLLLADAQQKLQVVAGSDETTKLLELYQMQHRQGPCLECFRTGEPIVNANLADTAQRWPQFMTRAMAAGFHSVHAIPLQLRGETLGALNLFDSQIGRLQPDDVRIVQSLADVVTIRLLHERASQGGELLVAQLQAALDSRIVIEQAKGAVAQQRQISVEEAFELIRAHSRRNSQQLSDLARTIVVDRARIAGLTD